MNILNILNQIADHDPEIYDRLDSRRGAMRAFAGLGKKIAVTSVPFLFGSMLNKAYGQTTGNSVLDVLNFALTLEYLEYRFYEKAVATPGLIPAGAPTGAITTIRDHEKAHVDFLKAAITGAGGTPVAEPTFDFTGGNGSNNGPFAAAFTDYAFFLAVAQAFEDTGVRAYKGQAPALVQTGDVLEAALRIHSVEARHAAHIRTMRRAAGANLKPWITGNDLGGLPAATAPIYAGEENTTHAGVNVTSVGGMTFTAAAASESFDEPLTKAAVLAIVDPFIV